jgi:muconate cycloisomerase
MKITKIECFCLQIPLVHAYALSNAYGVQSQTEIVTIKVHTDGGIVGIGEGNPWPAFAGETRYSIVSTIKYLFAPKLIGEDPTNLNRIHQIMDSLILGHNMAKAAIDMACYDIFGKATDMPVSKLLGGKLRDSVKVFWAVGGSTPEETAAEILKVKNDGYWGCMIKIGTDYKNDIARTLAAREAVGKDYPLIADANQGWDYETALLYGKGVESADLLFYEQPVKAHDVDSLAKLHKRLNTPISADEGVTNMHDAIRLVKSDACDVFSIKVSKHGGIMNAKRICDYANEHGISIFFNSMLEGGITQAASLNVAASVSNMMMTTGHSYFSTLRLKGDVTNFRDSIVNGVAYVSDKPGLGISIVESDLKKYTVETFLCE